MKNTTIQRLCLLPLVLLVLAAFTNGPQLGVTSSAFQNNAPIPAKYSCEGAGVSPPLQISGVPSAAKSLAIIVHDPDAPKAGGVTHWLVWNLPVDGSVSENFTGAMQGLNSDNKIGYKGMCPPSGTHHYNFRVYALDAMLTISNQTDKAGLEKAIQGHVLAQGILTGLYSKGQ